MTPEEFRRYGYQVIDWVADYWASIERYPVLAQVAPGDIAGRLPERAPEDGEPFDAVLNDMATLLPGVTHWQHPSYFGYFPANTSGPSVLGELLSSGFGMQGMLWTTGPVATELETVVLDWLVDLIGLPERFASRSGGGGVIQESASSAALVAMVAALQRATGGRWRTDGVEGPPLSVYTSTEGHSSIQKAARIAGLGDRSVRLAAVDPTTLAMRPESLRELIAADVAAGCRPAMVAATIGTTSTTAVDPLPAIADICSEYTVWLHIDAAYAGAAAVLPEFRWINAGLDRVDSYCFDPHKWLLTGFDCDAFWVADRANLVSAMSVLPEYLRNAATESGEVIDYRDWQVSLGRRFRAMKLWSVLRWYGAAGLREHIRSGVELAETFAGWVDADERFEVVAPHPFSLVCFRLRDRQGEPASVTDERTAELLRRMNTGGTAFLTHTLVGGRFTIRLAVGAPATEHRHLEAAWQRIADLASEILRGGS